MAGQTAESNGLNLSEDAHGYSLGWHKLTPCSFPIRLTSIIFPPQHLVLLKGLLSYPNLNSSTPTSCLTLKFCPILAPCLTPAPRHTPRHFPTPTSCPTLTFRPSQTSDFTLTSCLTQTSCPTTASCPIQRIISRPAQPLAHAPSTPASCPSSTSYLTSTS